MSGISLLEQQDFERSKWSHRHPKICKKDSVDLRHGKGAGGGGTEKKRVQKKNVVHDEKPLCRHFAEGYCKLGDMCNFEHSELTAYPVSQKVFLGGLPQYITTEMLVQELKMKGYQVINKPKIFRRFSPQVCLGSVQQAEELLRLRTVSINGCEVDVRPYKVHTKKELNRQVNINNRSVFLGGVPSSITVRILKEELEKLGMRVTNHPQIKARFIPKVTLASARQAEQLIAKGEIDLNGATVSVRPFMLIKNRDSVK